MYFILGCRLICLFVLLGLNDVLANDELKKTIRPQEDINFQSPIVSDRCSIFCPYQDLHKADSDLSASHLAHHHQLMANPEASVLTLARSLEDLDRLTIPREPKMTPTDRAREAYLSHLLLFLQGDAYGPTEVAVVPKLNYGRSHGNRLPLAERNPEKRKKGEEWSYLGKTMAGHLRMQNVKNLLVRVFNSSIPGSFLETGVWRGGMSIFARGVQRAFGQSHRTVIACDSFSGLPVGKKELHKNDVGWSDTPYLAVHETQVINNFIEAGVFDPHIFFVKGFFNNTMPVLRGHINSIAILRLDGDMYESTVDVLYQLYDKVSVGGYVIVDDWSDYDKHALPARVAVLDFFSVHRMSETIVHIDEASVYWQKTKQVEVQRDRYIRKDFKPPVAPKS